MLYLRFSSGIRTDSDSKFVYELGPEIFVTAPVILLGIWQILIFIRLLLLRAVQLHSLNVLAFSTIFFPFMSVLNAVFPIIYFHDIQIIFSIILPPSLGYLTDLYVKFKLSSGLRNEVLFLNPDEGTNSKFRNVGF
jgi:hypothetical protein